MTSKLEVYDANGALKTSGAGGSGTVTSVALTATPTGVFDVSGSPITTSGTLALSMDNQNANTVLAGPTSGAAATPAFRALAAADLANLLPRNYRAGLRVHRLTDAIVEVQAGVAIVNGTLVEKLTHTRLGMATAGDWIGGASGEGADDWTQVYVDASGNLKLHTKFPNYPRPDTASRIATMLVNQAGWNGTAGSGLNAASVVYDGDTGEGSVTAGMLLGVYGSGDSDYGTGRGKGSAAGADTNHWSWALITAIDTGTNTLTLDTSGNGHQIAFNDNDRLIVIDASPPLYRDESSTWYRWLGSLYNNASSNLVFIYNDNGTTELNTSDFTTTSTSFTNVTDVLIRGVLSDFNPCQVTFIVNYQSTVVAQVNFNVAIDGSDYIGEAGPFLESISVNTHISAMPLALPIPAAHLMPGTHLFQLRTQTNTGTLTVFRGDNATGFAQTHPRASFQEVVWR